MDALSRLLMLNDPQGSIDQNCLLSKDWQLPHAAGELVRHPLAYGHTRGSPTGHARWVLFYPAGRYYRDLAAKLCTSAVPDWR